MSETWTSLLAALVGAIVGGAASLAGTMLVNKQQMATNARMRLYDELLPKLSSAVRELYEAPSSVPADPTHQLRELATAIQRTSALVGRKERAAAREVYSCWRGVQTIGVDWEIVASTNSEMLRELENKYEYGARYKTALVRLAFSIKNLSDLLEAKLG